MSLAEDDPEGRTRLAAFAQALMRLGWSEGRNLRIETRWATGGDIRRHAAELAALGPDVLLAANGTSTVAPLLEATRTVPIVFVNVIDPVGAGFVASLAQPGGNATGFTAYEYSMSGKWLELLREIAPRMTRAAVLRDPALASGISATAVWSLALRAQQRERLRRIGVLLNLAPDDSERKSASHSQAQ